MNFVAEGMQLCGWYVIHTLQMMILSTSEQPYSLEAIMQTNLQQQELTDLIRALVTPGVLYDKMRLYTVFGTFRESYNENCMADWTASCHMHPWPQIGLVESHINSQAS